MARDSSPFDLLAPLDLPGLTGRRLEPACLADITGAPMRHLFSWWQAIADQRPPDWNDFDVLDHAAIVSHIYLVERVDDAYVMRLTGEEYNQLIKYRRGHRWSVADADPVARDYARFLDVVASAQRPYRGTGRLKRSDQDWIAFESLTCPMQPGNGKNAGFLCCIGALPGDLDE